MRHVLSFIDANPFLCLVAALCVLLAPYMLELVRKEPRDDHEAEDED